MEVALGLTDYLTDLIYLPACMAICLTDRLTARVRIIVLF